MKYLQLFEQFINEKSVPKKFGSQEQFDWKDVEQNSPRSFIGTIKNAKYKMQMKVPDIKRLFIETFDVLTNKFGYEDHQALNYLNSGSYAAWHVLNNHDGIDGERRYAYNPEGRMEEILLGFETLSTWKKLRKTFDNGGKIKESVIPNMKHTHHHEQFLNEKVYRMTGIYTAKGLVGKVMQAFKQEIARVKYEGINVVTQEEVNKEWAKFEDKAKKIILDQVEKGAGGMDGILFVTANLFNGFAIDEVNGLNREGSNTLYLSYEVVINVGFMDDFNGKKVARKIDKTGMMNSPISYEKEVIYGEYDASVGNNNLEIRDTEFIQIDGK